VDITELDRESAELLPDRQALGCWNYGWHGSGYGHGCGHQQSWASHQQGWGSGHQQGWGSGCGHSGSKWW